MSKRRNWTSWKRAQAIRKQLSALKDSPQRKKAFSELNGSPLLNVPREKLKAHMQKHYKLEHMFVIKHKVRVDNKVYKRGDKIFPKQVKDLGIEGSQLRPITFIKSKEERKKLAPLAKKLDLIISNGWEHGFTKKKSIISLSNWAKKKKYFITIDLKSAFNQMTFSDIYYLLKVIGFQENVARTMASLVIDPSTRKAYQGSPLTPVMFNIYILKLLIELNKLKGVEARSYADDIIIGGDDYEIKELIPIIHKICRKWHYVLNENKTKFFNIKSGQRELGLIFRPIINIPRIRTIKKRALEATRNLSLELHASENNNDLDWKAIGHYSSQLSGYLGWVHAPRNTQSDNHFTIVSDPWIKYIITWLRQKVNHSEEIFNNRKFIGKFAKICV